MPEKIILKNNRERKEFIANYQKWGIWKEIPELNLKYYRYVFDSGDWFVITEFVRPGNAYVRQHTENKYCLVATDNTPYKGGYGQFYTTFDPAGSSEGNMIDYLTKVRPEVINYG